MVSRSLYYGLVVGVGLAWLLPSSGARLEAAEPASEVAEYPEGPDLDEIPAGREKARETLNTLGERRLELEQLLPRHAPLIASRTRVTSALAAASAERADATMRLKTLQADRASYVFALDAALLAGELIVKDNLTAKLSLIEDDIRDTKDSIAASERLSLRLNGELGALSQEIAPIEQRLQAIWQDMMDLRRQWIAERDLFKKFARADLEQAEQVIQEWDEVDGAWSEMYCFAALVSVRQGKLDLARRRAEQAEKAWKQYAGTQDANWPLLDAVQALILVQERSTRQKGLSKLEDAYRRANSLAQSDHPADAWLLFLLIGEAYAQTETRQKQALAAFDRAVDSGAPDSMVSLSRCLVLLEGRSDLRDPQAAYDLLLPIWTRTGERSWRIAYALTIAEDALGEAELAQAYWRHVEAGAPPELLASLAKRRAATTTPAPPVSDETPDPDMADEPASSSEPPKRKSRKQRAQERATTPDDAK